MIKIIAKPQHQVGVINKCDWVLFNARYLYFVKYPAQIVKNDKISNDD